ncbi:protease complex subunit PrcB family protein [Flavobacterium orientale]|uniref:PrcB C-terminal n=1 Tax=Flavobacterium orientale TaxID=1756020 RepID=A0A917DA55_9FLAO|nr:protease complex subunit PrcB family protein [Flavobacterium orientale]GGD20970.1 hypothetical protein GCM10011343_09300 [Flavobacterium orientale]
MKTRFQENKTKSILLGSKNLILIFAAIFSFLSCSNNDDEPFTPVNIEYELIGIGMLRGAGSEDILPGNYVINSQVDWLELLNKMNSFDSNTTNEFTTTNINFQTHIVIAVFDELRGNPGWLIEIASIIENENNVVIDVINLNPGSIQSAMRQPYQIVRIPITNKPILFE